MTTQRLGWLAAAGIALTVAVGACIPTGAGVPAGTPGTSSSPSAAAISASPSPSGALRQTVVRLSEPDAAADLPRLHRPPGRHPDLDRSRAGHDRAQHRVLEPAALPVARPQFAALRAEPDRSRLGARARPGCRARPRGPAGTVAVGLAPRRQLLGRPPRRRPASESPAGEREQEREHVQLRRDPQESQDGHHDQQARRTRAAPADPACRSGARAATIDGPCRTPAGPSRRSCPPPRRSR